MIRIGQKWNNGTIDQPRRKVRLTEALDNSVDLSKIAPVPFAPGMIWYPASKEHALVALPNRAMGRLSVVEQKLELVVSALNEAGDAFLAEADLQGWLAQATQVASSQEGEVTSHTVTAEQSVMIEGFQPEHFYLACPVAELDWIDHWMFDLLQSESGKNEVDCVFLEPFTGMFSFQRFGLGTHWYMIIFDPEQYRFTAMQLVGTEIVGKWEIEMEELGNARARWDIRLTFAAITETGERMLAERGLEERMQDQLRFVLTSARHYIQTGELLRLPKRRMAQLAITIVGSMIGRRHKQMRLSA